MVRQRLQEAQLLPLASRKEQRNLTRPRFFERATPNQTAHIKSRPHHPMTLGMIERFWPSLWQEFLVRAQFESFETARQRIKL